MIRTYRCVFEGVTPLLMHWDNIDWADQMEAWKNDPANKKKSKAGDDRTPAFRWIGCVYHDSQQICVSSDNLSRCLMEGGVMVPVPGAGKKTFKSQTQSGMAIKQMFVPLINNGKTIPWSKISALMLCEDFSKQKSEVEKLGFRLLVKRAPVGQSKHIRVRPLFENWRLDVEIDVWDDQITEQVLTNIITYAGTYKGLCDWRPGGKTPGRYGMFKLAEIESNIKAA